MASTIEGRIQLRDDSSANWTANNPTLAVGEVGYETDTGLFKIGDGSTAWTSLGYKNPAASTTVAGLVELATDAEVATGTDTARAVTPASVAASYGAKPLFAYKTATETVNTSSVLQDDDDLAVTVAADTVYEVHARLIYDSATGADFSVGWSGPSGATLDNWNLLGLTNAATSNEGSIKVPAQTDINAGPSVGGAGVGTKLVAEAKGLLIVGGTAGTFQLRWAQRASDASNTSVYAGSYLRVTPLDPT